LVIEMTRVHLSLIMVPHHMTAVMTTQDVEDQNGEDMTVVVEIIEEVMMTDEVVMKIDGVAIMTEKDGVAIMTEAVGTGRNEKSASYMLETYIMTFAKTI